MPRSNQAFFVAGPSQNGPSQNNNAPTGGNKRQRSVGAFVTALVLAASLSPAVVSAQAAPAAQAPAQTQPAIKPTDAQLEKFATASQKVSGVADEYRPKLQAAKDDASRQQVYREADEKMVKVVQADGLTVDEFNGIGQAVQQDAQLRQRVIDIAQKKAPPGTAAPQ